MSGHFGANVVRSGSKLAVTCWHDASLSFNWDLSDLDGAKADVLAAGRAPTAWAISGDADRAGSKFLFALAKLAS